MDGLAQLYVDGTLEISKTMKNRDYEIAADGHFVIGRCFGPNCDDSFIGNISHLSMWSRALSSDIIFKQFKNDTFITGNVLAWSDFRNSGVRGLKMVNISGQFTQGEYMRV